MDGEVRIREWAVREMEGDGRRGIRNSEGKAMAMDGEGKDVISIHFPILVREGIGSEW
jgi:hypothetical protein